MPINVKCQYPDCGFEWLWEEGDLTVCPKCLRELTGEELPRRKEKPKERTFGSSVVDAVQDSAIEFFGELSEREKNILLYGLSAGMKVHDFVEGIAKEVAKVIKS